MYVCVWVCLSAVISFFLRLSAILQLTRTHYHGFWQPSIWTGSAMVPEIVSAPSTPVPTAWFSRARRCKCYSLSNAVFRHLRVISTPYLLKHDNEVEEARPLHQLSTRIKCSVQVLGPYLYILLLNCRRGSHYSFFFPLLRKVSPGRITS